MVYPAFHWPSNLGRIVSIDALPGSSDLRPIYLGVYGWNMEIATFIVERLTKKTIEEYW